MTVTKKRVTHIKDGAPKYIRCYVIPNMVYDAWTVVFTKVHCWQIPRNAPRWLKAAYIGKLLYVSMTQSGAYCHGEADSNRCYFGKQIRFSDLTLGQRRTVIEEYEACWRIKFKVDEAWFPVDWEVDNGK